MSKNRRQHVERALARVEQERREHPLTEQQIQQFMADYESDDPRVRARALRRSCPCHVSWEAYEQLRKPALRLRRDPNPEVRAIADHLEEDARQLESMEADFRRWMDEDDSVEDPRSRSRAR
jgi:hypothetical protein